MRHYGTGKTLVVTHTNWKEAICAADSDVTQLHLHASRDCVDTTKLWRVAKYTPNVRKIKIGGESFDTDVPIAKIKQCSTVQSKIQYIESQNASMFKVMGMKGNDRINLQSLSDLHLEMPCLSQIMQVLYYLSRSSSLSHLSIKFLHNFSAKDIPTNLYSPFMPLRLKPKYVEILNISHQAEHANSIINMLGVYAKHAKTLVLTKVPQSMSSLDFFDKTPNLVMLSIQSSATSVKFQWPRLAESAKKLRHLDFCEATIGLKGDFGNVPFQDRDLFEVIGNMFKYSRTLQCITISSAKIVVKFASNMRDITIYTYSSWALANVATLQSMRSRFGLFQLAEHLYAQDTHPLGVDSSHNSWY